MNPTGGSVSIPGLLGSTGNGAGTVATGAGSAAGQSPKSLKNNEFSDVLEGQQQGISVQTTKVAKPAETTGTVDNSSSAATAAVNFGAFTFDEDGNLLPLSGEALPLVADTEALPLEGITSAEAESTDDGSALILGLVSEPQVVTETVGNHVEGEEATATELLPTAQLSLSGDSQRHNNGIGVQLVTPNASTTDDTGDSSITGVTLFSRDRIPQTSVPTQMPGQFLRADQATANTAADTAAAAPSSVASLNSHAASVEEFAAALKMTRQQLKANTTTDSGLFSRELSSASITTAADSVSAAAAINPRVDVAAPTANSAIYQAAVTVPVGRQGWNDAVMNQVMWMSSQNISEAEVALDPPELGPLQVRISSQGDQTSVSFNSAHSVVRDTLDQGLGRLRELMQSQGINLIDVDVSDQNQQQWASSGQQGTQSGNGGSRSDDSLNSSHGDLTAQQQTDAPASSVLQRRVVGLVDDYA